VKNIKKVYFIEFKKKDFIYFSCIGNHLKINIEKKWFAKKMIWYKEAGISPDGRVFVNIPSVKEFNSWLKEYYYANNS
jgi:hypothetical protein